MANKKKIGLWIAGILGGLLLLLVAFILALPWIVDQQQVKDVLQSRLSQQLGGEMTFATAEVFYFPPRAEFTDLRIQRPGISGTAASVRGDINLSSLLFGKLQLESIVLQEPFFSIHPAAFTKQAQPSGGQGLEAIQNQLSTVLSQMGPVLESASIRIHNGAAVIQEEGKPEYRFRDLTVMMTLPGETLDLSLTCTSSMWASLKLLLTVDRNGTIVSGDLSVQGIQVLPVAQFLEQDMPKDLNSTRVSLQMDFRSQAPGVVQGSLKGKVESGQIPVPVELAAADFVYSDEGLSVRNASLSTDQANLQAASARLNLDGEKRLKIESAAATLHLKQTIPWVLDLLAWIDGFKEAIPDYESLSGTVSISSLNLEGPLQKPDEWKVQGRGTTDNLRVEAEALPAPFKLKHGAFEGNRKRISGTFDGIAILDSNLSISGSADDPLQGVSSLDLDISGDVSGKATTWLKDQELIPFWVKTNRPIAISKGNLVWDRDQDTSARGNLVWENGPEIAFDLVSDQKKLTIRKMDFRGADSKATMSGIMAQDVVDFDFKGRLTEQAVQELVASNRLQGWMNGDFKLHFPMQHPKQARILGTLQAGGFAFESGIEPPVQVEKITLQGEEKRLVIETADLMWNETNIGVNGTVGFAREGFDLDLVAITGDLKWEQIKKFTQGDGLPKKEIATMKDEAEGPGPLDDLQIEGSVMVKADRFSYGDLSWEPFYVTIEHRGDRLKVNLTRGSLCGIKTEASASLSSEPMQVEAEAAAKDEPIAQAMDCFLEFNLMNGDFSLSGELKSQGQFRSFLDHLQGDFTLTAEDGRIYKFNTLAKILAVVNITEVLKGKAPDLADEGFGYEDAKISGVIDKGVLTLKKGYFKGKSLDLAFKGDLNLPKQQVNVVVLVTPLKTVDNIIESIPIVDDILGENFIALPVRVEGDLSKPNVIPLSPSAVGKGFLGIIERTLKLPLKVVEPFMPDEEKEKPE